jgi:hypothetical protein
VNPAPVKKTGLIIALVLLFSGQSLFADLIILKDGRQIDGDVVNQTYTTITVDREGKREVIVKRGIRKIQFGNADLIRNVARREKALEEQKRRLEDTRSKAEEEPEAGEGEKALTGEEFRRLQEMINELKSETQKLSEELRLARQEAELQRKARLKTLEKKTGTNPEEWIEQESLGIATSGIQWHSAAMQLAYQMGSARILNLAAVGWRESSLFVSDPETKIPMGKNIRIIYGARSPVHEESMEFGLFYTSAAFHSAMNLRRSAADYIYPAGGTSYAISYRDTDTQLFDSPDVARLDLFLRKKYEIFSGAKNRYLQPLNLVLGGSVTGDGINEKRSIGHSARNSSVTPSNSTAETWASYGAGPRTTSLEYTQGALSVDVGLFYSYDILENLALDLRLNRRFGIIGTGSYECEGNSLVTLEGYWIPVTMKYSGDITYEYSGSEVEMGFSYFYDNLKIRLLAFQDYRTIKITDSDVKRSWDWFYIASAFMSGDVNPLIMNNLDPMGPFPSSYDSMNGFGVEVTAQF